MELRVLSVLVLVVSFNMLASAKPVVSESAKNVAINWMQERNAFAVKANAAAPSGVPLSVAKIFSEQDRDTSAALYFIVNLSPTGYVIVSGDDRAHPVIYYALDGQYRAEIHCPSFEFMLSESAEQIAAVIRQPSGKVLSATSSEWTRLASDPPAFRPSLNGAKGIVAKMVGCTWNQDDLYNESCPEDANGPGGHVYAGCVAVAMAQVMWCHDYPDQGKGIHTYRSRRYGTLTVNYGEATYDWPSMPSSLHNYPSPLPADKKKVSDLLFHCGVAVSMDYGPDLSGSNLPRAREALVNHFGYKTKTVYVKRSSYKSSAWTDLMKTEMDNYRPVIYGGDSETGGHAFVIDGYDDAGLFHVNWGWDGQDNGNYNLNDLVPENYDFRSHQDAVVRICKGTEPTLIGVHDLNQSVKEVGFSADGNGFFTVDSKAQIATFWELQTGQRLADLNAPAGQLFRSISYSPDGKYILVLAFPGSGTNNPTAVLYDANLDGGARQRYVIGPVSSALVLPGCSLFSSDGQYFIFANRIYETETGALRVNCYTGDGYEPWLLQFHPNGGSIVGCKSNPGDYKGDHQYGSIFLDTWNYGSTEQPVRQNTWGMGPYVPLPNEYARTDSNTSIQALSFSPEGERVVYLDYRAPKFLDVNDFQRSDDFYGPLGNIIASNTVRDGYAVFSPANGNLVLAYGRYLGSSVHNRVSDNWAILADCVNHTRLLVFPDVSYAAFSPDGSMLLTVPCSPSSFTPVEQVRLWSTSAGPQGGIRGVRAVLRNAAVQRNGRTLTITADASGKGTVNIQSRIIPRGGAKDNPDKGIFWLPSSAAPLTLRVDGKLRNLYSDIPIQKIESVAGGGAQITNIVTKNLDPSMAAAPQILANGARAIRLSLGSVPADAGHVAAVIDVTSDRVDVTAAGIGVQLNVRSATDGHGKARLAISSKNVSGTRHTADCDGFCVTGGLSASLSVTGGNVRSDVYASEAIGNIAVRSVQGDGGKAMHDNGDAIAIASGWRQDPRTGDNCDIVLLQATGGMNVKVSCGVNSEAIYSTGALGLDNAGSLKKVVTKKGAPVLGRYWSKESLNGTTPRFVPSGGSEFSDFLPGAVSEWPR